MLLHSLSQSVSNLLDVTNLDLFYFELRLFEVDKGDVDVSFHESFFMLLGRLRSRCLYEPHSSISPPCVLCWCSNYTGVCFQASYSPGQYHQRKPLTLSSDRRISSIKNRRWCVMSIECTIPPYSSRCSTLYPMPPHIFVAFLAGGQFEHTCSMMCTPWNPEALSVKLGHC